MVYVRRKEGRDCFVSSLTHENIFLYVHSHKYPINYISVRKHLRPNCNAIELWYPHILVCTRIIILFFLNKGIVIIFEYTIYITALVNWCHFGGVISVSIPHSYLLAFFFIIRGWALFLWAMWMIWGDCSYY